MTLTISYSHTDGTLLLGTARGDGSNTILKQLNCGWRWSPKLGAWYVRGSRNKPADTLIIDLTKAALEDVGFIVNVTTPTMPKVTPLTVAQQTQQRAKQQSQTKAVNGGHVQVHIKHDGDIVLDLSSSDTQTAVEFIRTLLRSRMNTPSELSDQEDDRSLLQQFRQTPEELGPRESLVWNYLRTNDSPEGVAVINIREDLGLRQKQASPTLDRLQNKGFAARVSFGRWRALNPDD